MTLVIPAGPAGVPIAVSVTPTIGTVAGPVVVPEGQTSATFTFVVDSPGIATSANELEGMRARPRRGEEPSRPPLSSKSSRHISISGRTTTTSDLIDA